MFDKVFRGRFGLGRGADQGAVESPGRGKGGRGRGGGNKPGSGPGGNCICPKCGHKELHVAGKRCMDQVCPKCGTRMARE